MSLYCLLFVLLLCDTRRSRHRHRRRNDEIVIQITTTTTTVVGSNNSGGSVEDLVCDIGSLSCWYLGDNIFVCFEKSFRSLRSFARSK